MILWIVLPFIVGVVTERHCGDQRDGEEENVTKIMYDWYVSLLSNVDYNNGEKNWVCWHPTAITTVAVTTRMMRGMSCDPKAYSLCSRR